MFYWEISITRYANCNSHTMRYSVLDLAHEGHPGIVAMKSLLRSKV